MKSFRSIPGPSGYIAWQSLTGSYKLNELHKISFDLYRKYGPIVRQKVLPGVNLLSLFDPEDISTIANDFSKKDFPNRSDHFALIKYRADRPETYNHAGLLPTNGPEWWRLRSALQKNISKPVYLRQFISSTNGILNEFVAALDESIDPNGPVDIERYLSNLNLELIVHATFGVRTNALTKEELRPDSHSSALIAAAYEANSLTLKLDQQLPVWKIWHTPLYQRYERCLDLLHVEGERLLKRWRDNKEVNRCLMDDYVKEPTLTEKDLLVTAEDYLLAGTDTTSITMSMVLYEISRNAEVQQKILEEINSVLKRNEDPTNEMFNNQIPYTRAVLKESLRLHPISIGFGRYLTKDMEIRGYHIPKKTMVVTQNWVASRLPENFHRPLDFLPNRWLKDVEGENKAKPNSFVVLPFGHGMRGCIARRFAEQNMLLTLIKLVRSYQIIYAGPAEEVEIETLLINRPKYPVQLILKRRTENK